VRTRRLTSVRMRSRSSYHSCGRRTDLSQAHPSVTPTEVTTTFTRGSKAATKIAFAPPKLVP
jgi:hypothetical protein